MSRLNQKQECWLTQHSLQSLETRNALHQFCDLFRVCGGLYGRNHVVRSSSGGHVTLTGSCRRLMASLSLTRPILKLISSSVQAHLQRCGDSGLFMTYFCSRLILLGSDLDIKYHTLKTLNEVFVNIVTDAINADSRRVAIQVGLDQLDVLLAYVKSILSSKTLLNLNQHVSEQLSQLVLKVFLESIPEEVSKSNHSSWKSDRIYCMTVENKQFSDSSVKSGILLQFQEHYRVDTTSALNIPTFKLDQVSSDRLNVPLGVKVIKVAVFSCSMAGDAGEMLDVHYEVSVGQEQQAEDLVVDRMLALCGQLLHKGIGLLLCQKVIHPRVKVFLRSKGILWVDRLGSAVMPYIQDLTGAIPMSTILTWNGLDDFFGCVSSVTTRQEKGQSYLHLMRDNSSVVTFIICGPTEEKVAELKSCMSGCFKGLGHVITDRKLLMGGGCWQVQVAQRLSAQVSANLKQMSQEASCSELDVVRAAAVFRICLLGWALTLKEDCMNLLTEPVSAHAWRILAGSGVEEAKDERTKKERGDVTCACGMKSTSRNNLRFMQLVTLTKESAGLTVTPDLADQPTLAWDSGLTLDTVLDGYTASVSALRQAVATANLVLSIGQFVVDVN